MDYNEKILSSSLVKDARRTLRRHRIKRWRRRNPEEIRGVVYHQALGAKMAADTAAFHVGANFLSDEGLPSLAYTMFVEPDGKALLCNDVEDVTWSQGDRSRPGDENVTYLAVCFGGHFSGPGHFYPGSPTPEQLSTAVDLWEHLRDVFNLDPAAIYGHFDFGKPACPGYTLEALVRRTREAAAPVVWRDLRQQQQILKDIGLYRGPVDGLWGPGTAGAIREFRDTCKLPEKTEWDHDVECAFLESLDGKNVG